MSKPETNSRRVLLAGATGLVGGEILTALLADEQVTAVHVLSRRELYLLHPKLFVQVVDFQHLPPLPEVDEVYLALGTTMAVAGNQAAFRAVDLDANLAVARAAVAAGAQRLALVSAAGANANSMLFYNRVKGELEAAIKALPLRTLVIAQPSVLMGNRKALDQPTRVGERIAIAIARWLSPLLPGNYQPVAAKAVASALVATLPGTQGFRLLNSRALSLFAPTTR